MNSVCYVIIKNAKKFNHVWLNPEESRKLSG